jgi:hypothetical protein
LAIGFVCVEIAIVLNWNFKITRGRRDGSPCMQNITHEHVQSDIFATNLNTLSIHMQLRTHANRAPPGPANIQQPQHGKLNHSIQRKKKKKNKELPTPAQHLLV